MEMKNNNKRQIQTNNKMRQKRHNKSESILHRISLAIKTNECDLMKIQGLEFFFRFSNRTIHVSIQRYLL